MPNNIRTAKGVAALLAEHLPLTMLVNVQEQLEESGAYLDGESTELVGNQRRKAERDSTVLLNMASAIEKFIEQSEDSECLDSDY